MNKYCKPEIDFIVLQENSILSVSTGVDQGLDYIEDNYGW